MAVSAHNAYDNNSGYSPNQLVFGFNPAIPNIYNSNLPGLENVTSSEIVRRNLNALHVARQEFVKFESDERIKRALRHNVRNTCIDNLENGNEVYYKRNDAHKQVKRLGFLYIYNDWWSSITFKICYYLQSIA